MEHHSTSKKTALTRLLYITMAFAWLSTVAQPVETQVEPTVKTPPQAGKIPLFATPDDSSALVDAVERNEVLTPMAETLGAGGTKWYLVKTKSGMVGWIKAGDTNESKKVEHFFKSRPNEPAIFNPTELPSSPSGARSRGGVTVPVDTRGSLVLLRVTFNRSVTASLILDTGASRTMISRRIAAALALPSTGVSLMAGIGGVVAAHTAHLESVQIGEAEVSNLMVIVHDFSRDPRYEGLLGLDFLNHFHVSLDAKNHFLVLRPR